MLPLRPGQTERATPECSRNGTTSLFAALDVATGRVVGTCYPKHRSKEFLSFLRLIDKSVDPELDVHLILDKYATHKTVDVRRWAAKHPRFHFHFTPTHAAWLNQVEIFFNMLTNQQLKRGSHHSVSALKHAIMEFIEVHNTDPEPFRWTKSADDILGSVAKHGERVLTAHRLATNNRTN